MNILKVNMTEGKIDSMPVPEGKVLGGRGMIDYLMTEYGSATAHPPICRGNWDSGRNRGP
jgi:aldehyde:ferredoxin oxidoreductase